MRNRERGYIVVGLGNPGEEYALTRHNAGRRAVERFREEHGCGEWKRSRSAEALVAEGEIGGVSVTLLFPERFMNRSGASVAALVKSLRAAERLIVAYDDIDLPLGSVKISFGRSSGGHKGLESVIRALKTRDFARVRIGVSPAGARGKVKKPRGDDGVKDFLLSAFSKREAATLESALERAAKAIAAIVTDGREKAMSVFNAPMDHKTIGADNR
jgi:PTH1 family peptidyl-tRNA hydrolase